VRIPPARLSAMDRGGTQRAPSLPQWVLRLPPGAGVVARVKGVRPHGLILSFRDGPGRFILSQGPEPLPAKGAEVELVVTRDDAGRTTLQPRPPRSPLPQGRSRTATAAPPADAGRRPPSADRPARDADAAALPPRPAEDGRSLAGKAAVLLAPGEGPVRPDEPRVAARADAEPDAGPGRAGAESRAVFEVVLAGGLGPVQIDVLRRGGLLTVDLKLADAQRAALCARRLPSLAAALTGCQALPVQLGCAGADGDGRYLWRPGEGSER